MLFDNLNTSPLKFPFEIHVAVEINIYSSSLSRSPIRERLEEQEHNGGE